MTAANEHSDVFVSYRRTDIVFTRRLVGALQRAGKEVWVDWEDIPPGSDFPDDIRRGLEAADAFIAVLSPDYFESTYTMDLELRYAMSLNKKIIPLVIEPFDPALAIDGISHINWIHFIPHAGQQNDFEEALPLVLQALDTDLEHVRESKRLLVRALEWKNNASANSYLLRGDEIDAAERWLSRSTAKDPQPTELHQTYIYESRRYANRQANRLLAGVSVALAVVAVLAVLSIILANRSLSNAAVAREQAATATNAQGLALIEAARAETQAAIALDNAATATVAQGRALLEADNAATQAAIALDNAATATVAQGRALLEADNAATQAAFADIQAAIANQNAATATVAQGRAQEAFDQAATQAVLAKDSAGTAQAAQNRAEEQRAIALRNENIAEQNAAAAATAQSRAQREAWRAETQAAIANQNAATATVAQGAAQQQANRAETQSALAYANATSAALAEAQAIDIALQAQSAALAEIAQSSLENDALDRAAPLILAAYDLFGPSPQAERVARTIALNGTETFFVGTHSGGAARLVPLPAGADSPFVVASVGGNNELQLWGPVRTGQRQRLTIPLGADPLLGGRAGQQVPTFAAWNARQLWILAPDGTIRESATLPYNSGTIRDVFHDGQKMRIVTVDDATSIDLIRVLDGDGTQLALFRTLANTDREYLPVAAFNIRGDLLAVAGDDDDIRVWELENYTLQRTLTGHTLAVRSIQWSRNAAGQDLLASVDNDPDIFFLRSSSTARLWDGSGTPFVIFDHEDAVTDVAFSPDGEHLLTVGLDGRAITWDIAARALLVSQGAAGFSLQSAVWQAEVGPWVGAPGGELLDIGWQEALDDVLATVQDCCVTRPLTDQEAQRLDLPLPAAPPPPALIPSCEDAPASRLYVGARARVADEDPRPLNFRTGSGLNAGIQRQLPPDTLFRVVGGPTCRDGFAWFEVIFGTEPFRGWIAEGDANGYFVEVVP